MKATFLDLVKTASPTRGERTLADYLIEELKALGLTAEEDDLGTVIGGTCGNVWAHLKANAEGLPHILFSAHMDTVMPCEGIDPIEEDGIITSRTETVLGGDDKAGITAILEALRIITRTGEAHGDITVLFTVAEEGGLLGSRCLDASQLTAEMGFVFDSSGRPGRIITAAPGENSLTVTIRGRKSHAGLAPENGLNAITLAAHAVTAVRQGRIDAETTANIGIITGGTATNIVPDLAVMRAEVRSRDMDKLEAITRETETVMRSAVEARGGTLDWEEHRGYDAYDLAENSTVVTLARAAAEACGLVPTCEATGGGSDANNLNRFGLPSVVLGIGMSDVHTTSEYIRSEDIYRSGEWALAIVRKAARQAGL